MRPTRRAAESRPARRPLPRVGDGPFLVVVWLLLTLLLSSWSLTTPLFASPDESAQVVKAAAVAHGQVTGETVYQPGTYFEIITEVGLPAYYGTAMDTPSCYISDTSEPADCAPEFAASDEEEQAVQTWIGRYPPLYYAVVGLPSTVLDGEVAVYSMRVVSSVLCAFFFALGLTALRRTAHPRAMVAAGALAITPSAAFFGGVVNSSGLEIASGFATWCLLAPLVRSSTSRGLHARLLAGTVSAVVLVNTRPGSGLLALLIAVCLVGLATRGFWRAAFTGRRWIPVVAVAAGGVVVAGTWLVVVDPTASLGGIPDPALADRALAVEGALRLTGRYTAEQLAVFGSLNVTLDPLLLLLLGGTIAVLAVAGIVLGRGAPRWVTLALVVLVFVVPIASQVPRAADLGLIWQGRYGLPLSIGLPVVSMIALCTRPGAARAARLGAPLVLAVAATAQTASLLWALWRYTMGFGDPPFASPVEWAPPGEWTSVVVASLLPFVLADVLLALPSLRDAGGGPGVEDDDGPGAETVLPPSDTQRSMT